MRSVARSALPVLLVLLALGTLPTGVAGADLRSTGDVEIDDIHLGVAVTESGDAEWTVEHRSRLHTDDRREAFETVMTDIEETPEQFLEPFERNMVETATVAAQTTGREMTIEHVTVTAERVYLPQEYGLITYRFTWTGFAELDSDELRIGDAIGGLFLDDRSTLRIDWPAEFERQSVHPMAHTDHESGVTWRGPVDFAIDEPTIVVGSPASEPITIGSPLSWILLATIVLLITGGVVVLRRWRPQRIDDPTGQSGSAGPSLLTNEEQVIQVLEAAGGRCRQQQLVAELGWSETKTSQVLQSMHEAGTIDRFRLGRENVVSLSEESDI